MPPSERPRDILILCAEAALRTNTVSDHISAFRKFSCNKFAIIDSRAFEAIEGDLDRFDCLVLHYSLVISMETFLPNRLADKIKRFSGLKIAFIQDENGFVDRQNHAIAHLGIEVIFTVTNPEVTRKIYRDAYFDKVRFEHTLTGFQHLLSRPTKIASLMYPIAREKHSHGTARLLKKSGMLQNALRPSTCLRSILRYRYKREVSNYGNSWIDFITSSKGCRRGVGRN